MIELIRGEVVAVEPDYVVIERNGIGYQILMTNPSLLEEGQSVMVYTHLIVREDSWRLFGFQQISDRNLFRLLLEVSGIGPKAGLSMMTGGSSKQIIQAIEQEDMRFLTKLPGIGKKTAQRMIIDLKEKLPQHGFVVQDLAETTITGANNKPSFKQDVIDALVGLGYAESEASSVFRKVSQASTVEEAIKGALHHLMRR